jgi:Tfp pilus assembly protein PilP
MAPTAITEKYQPAVTAPTNGGAGGNGAAPVASAQPVLRGIAQNGGVSAAIIEYAGHSGFYRVGQYVGDERVNSISNNSVSLSDGSRLVLGR